MTFRSPTETESVTGATTLSLGPAQLFIAFSQMALSGFGGVMPFAYRSLVERRRWLEPHAFAAMLAMAQVLPGPTICNLSLMVGWRYAGVAGALAALAGMLAGPITIVLLLGLAYTRWGDVAQVHDALTGMGAVAAGLILSTAVKMALAVFGTRRTLASNLSTALIAALAFAGVGLVRWPLIAVVIVLAPPAIALAWKKGPA
jgi:chromate transporter